MIQWAEIAVHDYHGAVQFLESFLNEKKIANKGALITTATEDFWETLELAKKKYQQLRIGLEFQPMFSDAMVAKTIPQMMIGAADCLVLDSGRQWPRSMIYEGMQTLLKTKLNKVELDGAVLVLGSSGAMQAAVAALVRAGFQRITFVQMDPMDRLVSSLQKNFFSVKFEVIDMQSVTDLPAIHSLILNVLSIEAFEAVSHEMLYLNYLKPNAAWIDFERLPQDSSIYEEIKSFGVQYFGPEEVRAYSDLSWARHVVGLVNSSNWPLEQWVSEYTDGLKKLSQL